MGHHVGRAADRYSLASIAYEMLTGVIPFDGEGLMELLYAQVHREPSPPSARNPSLGPQVDAVVMRGLAKDPAARWDSCTQFVDELAAALASSATAAAPDKTVVLRPGALPATRPLAPGRAVAASAARDKREATMAMPMPASPAQPVPAASNGSSAGAHTATDRRRRSLKVVIAAVAVIVLLLVLGVCAAVAAQTPTLALTPSTVAAGGRVLVTAEHVPANKVGEIQLHSQLQAFPFRATAAGKVSREIVVPDDAVAGDHTVELCWDSACRARQTLHVVAAGTVLPTPVASPPAGTSPTLGASPIPGQTPTSNPTPGTTPRPTSPPTSQPAPTRSPSPIPSAVPSPKPTPPPPTPSPTVTLVSISSTGNTTVTFHYYFAGSATITIHQGSTTKAVTVPVAAGSSTNVTFKTPVGFLVTAVLTPQAYVTVPGLPQSNSVNVTL